MQSMGLGSWLAGLLLCCALGGAAHGGDIAAGADELSADNIVVVLDASGSMNEKMRGSPVRKMDAAKMALTAAMQQVPAKTQVGLLVFSAYGTAPDWLCPLGPLNRQALLAAVQTPEPGGGTPLGEYIKKAADVLLTQRKKQFGYGTYRLLIVTDGEASDPYLVDAYVPDAVRRGLRIDVIGVDMAAAHTLATKVQSYRKANDPEALRSAVAEVFAEVGGSGGADQTGAAAFAALAPLPDPAAQALLTALSAASDEPLSANRPGTEEGMDARSGTGPQPAVGLKPRKNDTGLYVLYAAGFIVFISVVRGLGGASRKKRR